MCTENEKGNVRESTPINDDSVGSATVQHRGSGVKGVLAALQAQNQELLLHIEALKKELFLLKNKNIISEKLVDA